MHEGNVQAGYLSKNFLGSAIEEAQKSHHMHNQNAMVLKFQFHIPRETARQIVKNCLICPAQSPIAIAGVNLRGLKPNALWQMDVTHVPSFSNLSFVNVRIDTYCHIIIASAPTGEAYKDVIQHVFFCFSYVGMP